MPGSLLQDVGMTQTGVEFIPLGKSAAKSKN